MAYLENGRGRNQKPSKMKKLAIICPYKTSFSCVQGDSLRYLMKSHLKIKKIFFRKYI